MLLGAKEVGGLLSVSERTATRMFQNKEIIAFQVNGKLWRTRRDLVDTYVTKGLSAAGLTRVLALARSA